MEDCGKVCERSCAKLVNRQPYALAALRTVLAYGTACHPTQESCRTGWNFSNKTREAI